MAQWCTTPNNDVNYDAVNGVDDDHESAANDATAIQNLKHFWK